MAAKKKTAPAKKTTTTGNLKVPAPDPATLDQIVAMVGIGADYADICEALMLVDQSGKTLTVETFEKTFERQIRAGFAKARIRVAQQAFEDAAKADPIETKRAIYALQERRHGKEVVPWTPWEPEREDRRIVARMAAGGLSAYQIGQLMGDPKTGKPIGENLVKEHFARELHVGSAKLISDLFPKAYDLAMGGDRKMIIFLLQSRAPEIFGWGARKEPDAAPAGGEEIRVTILGGLPK